MFVYSLVKKKGRKAHISIPTIHMTNAVLGRIKQTEADREDMNDRAASESLWKLRGKESGDQGSNAQEDNRNQTYFSHSNAGGQAGTAQHGKNSCSIKKDNMTWPDVWGFCVHSIK